MIFSSVNNLIINGHPAKRENPHVLKLFSCLFVIEKSCWFHIKDILSFKIYKGISQ